MAAEADMSRPSKRFVLPYEPEYTAHRTDGRAAKQGSAAQRAVAEFALVRRDSDGGLALDGALRRKASRAVKLERSETFPRQR
jgi:hypothetical protein